MIHDQDLPMCLWAEVAMAAVYVQNRLPHSALGLKTPEEIFTGKKPEVSHFKIFGCPVFIHIPKKQAGTLRKDCNVPFPLGSRNTVVVYPISRKPLNGQAREMTLVKSLLSYKVKLRKSEFINIKPLFEGIFSNY
jgi:hypothetical protein